MPPTSTLWHRVWSKIHNIVPAFDPLVQIREFQGEKHKLLAAGTVSALSNLSAKQAKAEIDPVVCVQCPEVSHSMHASAVELFFSFFPFRFANRNSPPQHDSHVKICKQMLG